MERKNCKIYGKVYSLERWEWKGYYQWFYFGSKMCKKYGNSGDTGV